MHYIPVYTSIYAIGVSCAPVLVGETSPLLLYYL